MLFRYVQSEVVAIFRGDSSDKAAVACKRAGGVYTVQRCFQLILEAINEITILVFELGHSPAQEIVISTAR